ncbi:MAG: glycosyl hydrolase family 8, partial [Mucilaginibacter sp.]
MNVKKIMFWYMGALLPVLANCQGQTLKKQLGKGAFISGVYPDLFQQAGYKKKDIDNKIAKAYHDIFEGPNKVYFEVGDS